MAKKKKTPKVRKTPSKAKSSRKKTAQKASVPKKGLKAKKAQMSTKTTLKQAPKATIAHQPVSKHMPAQAKAHPKSQLSTKQPREAHTTRRAGAPVCREVACELMATTGTYCRLHYIKNWKKVKRKEMILKERKLNHYIEELVSKYPDKYIEALRQDLESEKDFAKVISDLEIEENLDDFEAEAEGAEGIIDNLKDHLKRDFEDDEDLF